MLIVKNVLNRKLTNGVIESNYYGVYIVQMCIFLNTSEF